MQIKNKYAMLHILKIGGFNTMVDYESKFTDSTTIVSSLHNIKESIINWGSGLAIKEIAYQYDMLRLCETCQHSLEHGKRNSSPHPMYLAANINERVDRILDFMEVYPMKYALQCIALDALHLFVEKGNILKIKASPKLLPTVGKTLMEYVYTKPAIIWRAAVILQIVASLDQDLARDVALLEVHEPLCQAYSRLKRRPKIQQIILRFMGALAQWSGTSRVALLRSTVCMNLLTAIEAKVTEARHQVRAVEAEAKENLLKNFSQILTLELRSLIRESGGQRVFLPMEGQHAIHQQLFHRETVQQMALLKPLFRTTATKYFTPGDPGLL